MLFTYKALTKTGQDRTGTIEAPNEDVAIGSLQRRDLMVVSVTSAEKKSLLEINISFLPQVKNKEIVILSRQIATLFEAHVPALKVFRLLSAESENAFLAKKLNEVSDDIQGGMSMSDAFKKHPAIFSEFYVNMVRAGEESGKLNETFVFLADYLDSSYELTGKIKGAFIYPAFVISIFALVMIGMFTFIIPKIATILTSSGQELPIYTKIVLGLSDFLVNYGLFSLIALIVLGVFLWRYKSLQAESFARIALAIPVFGSLLQRLYLTRFSANMHTMLVSGIAMTRALEITATVVGNPIYKKVILDVAEKVRDGDPISEALARHKEMPNMMVQMVRVGEETGELAELLKKVSVFYKKEVDASVDTMISLIEPAMIVLLGLGVGTVLASVLLPIYNLSGGI